MTVSYNSVLAASMQLICQNIMIRTKKGDFNNRAACSNFLIFLKFGFVSPSVLWKDILVEIVIQQIFYSSFVKLNRTLFKFYLAEIVCC